MSLEKFSNTLNELKYSISLKRVVDETLKFLSDEFFVGSKYDEEKIKDTTIYLHRLLYHTGILTKNDLFRIDLKDIEDNLDGKEIIIKGKYVDLKGVVRRGVYRVSVHVKDNKISFGKDIFNHNLNYVYLNDPSQNRLIKEWQDQESGSDYVTDGPGNENSVQDWAYTYEYSDWTGNGYEVDYDPYHYDHTLWQY